MLWIHLLLCLQSIDVLAMSTIYVRTGAGEIKRDEDYGGKTRNLEEKG